LLLVFLHFMSLKLVANQSARSQAKESTDRAPAPALPTVLPMIPPAAAPPSAPIPAPFSRVVNGVEQPAKAARKNISAKDLDFLIIVPLLFLLRPDLFPPLHVWGDRLVAARGRKEVAVFARSPCDAKAS
jgi:hypothetical protein